MQFNDNLHTSIYLTYLPLLNYSKTFSSDDKIGYFQTADQIPHKKQGVRIASHVNTMYG